MPGGVGLTTAMTMLKSGWVIVGSLPSNDGTTATKGQGCLIVLDAQGAVAGTIAGADINGPWGNMAVIDHGATATLFVSNTGFGVGAPTDPSPVVAQATVLRLDLSIPDGKPPLVTKETVVADGLNEQADKGVFIIGPTGLALGAGGVLYVSDAIANRIAAIPDAVTRGDSAGTGKDVTKDGLLKRPLALAVAPNGHLLATNGLNGQVVEIDPATGRQLYAQWIDADKAQSPPGSGDLFGIAMTAAGDGFYYVEDDMNTVVRRTERWRKNPPLPIRPIPASEPPAGASWPARGGCWWPQARLRRRDGLARPRPRSTPRPPARRCRSSASTRPASPRRSSRTLISPRSTLSPPSAAT